MCKEYPYVDEEKELAYFNENSIMEQFVTAKWCSKTKKHYVLLDYIFTKMKDEFIVDVRDLTKGSHVKVEVSCPVCQEKRHIKFQKFAQTESTKCRHCVNLKNRLGDTHGDLTVIDFIKCDNGKIKWLCECKCGNKVSVKGSDLQSGISSCGCSRVKDLIGRIFGELTVIKRVNEKGQSIWLCQCNCGEMAEVTGSHLQSGTTRSCGCLRRKDITGQVFGKLTAIKYIYMRNTRPIWLCQCECGETTEAYSKHLINGSTQSCGCIRIKELSGLTFNRLTVIEFFAIKKGQAVWTCLCECGTTTNVASGALQSGGTKSCGCLHKDSMQKMRGKNNARWNPNLTDDERKNRRGLNVTIWAKTIKELDKYTCQTCGDARGGNLVSHHLNNYKDHPEQRTDLNNGVALCNDCHKKFHSWMGGNSVTCTRDDFVGFCKEFYPSALFLTAIQQ